MTLQTLKIWTDGCWLVGWRRPSITERDGRYFEIVRHDAIRVALLSPLVPVRFGQCFQSVIMGEAYMTAPDHRSFICGPRIASWSSNSRFSTELQPVSEKKMGTG